MQFFQKKDRARMEARSRSPVAKAFLMAAAQRCMNCQAKI
jgi:hypothetical protein